MNTKIRSITLCAGAAVCLAAAPAMADRGEPETFEARGQTWSNVRVLDDKEADAEHTARSGYTFDPFNLVVGDTLNTTILDVSSVPLDTYTSFSLTVDWSAISGNPWSNEALFGLWNSNTASYLNSGNFSPTNGQSSGAAITLNWSGNFVAAYNGVDGLEFDALQDFAGSFAAWNNISLTLNAAGGGPTLSDLSLATLGAGSVVAGNNGTGANDLNGPSGFGAGSWSGGDHVYELNWGGGDLDLELYFSHAQGDLDLILWGDDLALNLLGSSLSITDNEFISIAGLAAGTYWIHIDGWQGAAADYTLYVIPTPGAAAVFGLAGLAALRRRR